MPTDFHPVYVDSRMFMLRAKFLAFQGQVLADEQPPQVLETMQMLDGVLQAAMDAQRAGRILSVTATQFEPLGEWDGVTSYLVPPVDEDAPASE